MRRPPETIVQITVAALAVLGSWYGMMAVHEAAHCLGAWLTGGTVNAVKIPLIGFSYTESSGSRCPSLVVWAGLVFGAIAPLSCLLAIKHARSRLRHIILFFVGFCLLANGVYLGMGGFFRAGDCEVLHRLGTPIWVMTLAGIIYVPAGLWFWHCMGPMREWFRKSPPPVGTPPDVAR